MAETNFWWIAFEDNTIKFFDDEEQVTQEEWIQRASLDEVERLFVAMKEHPDLVPAVPPNA